MYVWTEFVRHVVTGLMGIVMIVNNFSVTLINIETSRRRAEVIYEFATSDEYSAEGEVTVNCARDGDYDLYWGTEDYEKLYETVAGRKVVYSEFAQVDVDDGTGKAEIQEFTAIPEGAESVLVFKGFVLCGRTDLPDEKTPDYGEASYIFGALSDVHFNRYFRSLADDARLTFNNALNFLAACDVDLVGLSGDLSADGELDAWEEFNKYASLQSFPVYTCTGNHDVGGAEGFDAKAWRSLINPDAYAKTNKRGDIEIAPNEIDFTYRPEKAGGDVFIFLSQLYWDYHKETSRLLDDTQLDWLETQLNQYKDKRVYLFFHTFLADDKLDPNLGEGNMINSAGTTYSLVYTVGTSDEVRFRALLKEHKNVIYFNGHSHWRPDMQKYNSKMNITDYDGQYCTMVHISSVSSPRYVKNDNDNSSNEDYMRSSQGLLVKVYPDRIVYTNVDFLRGKFLSYATFTK